ncbi:MAG: methyltransferase domain-containing protein, partial [Burkholderiales bacterium]
MSAAREVQTPAEAQPIQRAHIARSFGQAAAHYDEFAALQRAVADRLLLHAHAPAPETVLDLGCGTGYCAGRLRAQFPDANVVALDLALPMLRASATRVSEDTRLLCGDLQALPLRSASCDLAVCSLALQWCADVPRVFAELWRVLRPGGQALLSTFGPATLGELRAAWSSVDRHVHVNGFPPRAQLQQAAGAAGFDVRIATELHTRHYPALRALARELKGIGAHNMNA